MKASKHLNLKAFAFGMLMTALGSSPALLAQDIERSVETLRERLAQNPVDFSGGLTMNLRFNSISGMERRRDPFGINLMANATIDILGFKAPFSIAIADKNATYRLPAYSFVGISPSYKWIKLHLFRRSMSFSKYSLNGHGFNGAGFELTPGRFRLAAMYGTLRKARLQDYGLRQELDNFYQRKGYGVQVGYADQGDEIMLNVFRASDDETTLPLDLRTNIAAKENLVTSLTLRKDLGRVISLEGEYAYSIFTGEKNFPERLSSGIAKIFDLAMNLNSTSAASSAYNFNIKFNPGSVGTFTLGHERVNPDFVSLGTFQFQNDFENFTFGYTGRLLKKISLFSRIGLERNNLDAAERENRNRFVGQAQLSYPINKQWTTSLTYSNFKQTTRLTDATNINEVVDSIFLGSSSNQFGLNTRYLINETHSISGTISFQLANTISNDIITARTTKVLNMMVNYLISPKDLPYSGGVSLMYNSLASADIKSSSITPAARLKYTLSDQWNASLIVMNNLGFINSNNSGNLFRIGFSSSYSVSEKQRISLRLMSIQRNGDLRRFSEFNGFLGWNMRI